MGMNNPRGAHAALVDRYINTAYDQVKLVADSIDDVKNVSDALVQDVDFKVLADVLINISDSASDLAELAQADLVAISDDLVKGNYLGNRKLDIDLALNNNSTTVEVTYSAARLVSNDGVVLDIPFTVTDVEGNVVTEETASYAGIMTRIVNGIAAYNDGEPDTSLHLVNTEIDIINSTLPELPTMLRFRDTDGQASNIDRVELTVYSGDAKDTRPTYFWANTTSALQTLANRVGDIIALGNDVDSIIALAAKKDELEYLYQNRDALTEDADSIYAIRNELLRLHTSVDAIDGVNTNITAIDYLYSIRDALYEDADSIYNKLAEIEAVSAITDDVVAVSAASANMATIVTNLAAINTVSTNIQVVVDAAANAATAAAAADTATVKATEASASAVSSAASATAASDSATLASDKAATIMGVSVGTTITGSAGSSANVVYNPSTGEFRFVIPQGDKGDRGDAFAVNSVGELADRALYDAQNKGFSFLDIIESKIYFKLSNATSDWSVGASFGKGDKGDSVTGNGIVDIVRTSGDGSAGSTDIYTITFTDGGTSTFPVTHGADSAVLSVGGLVGDVTLSDLGLNNVSNTSDANKPVSTAQSVALGNKVDKVAGKQLSSEDFTEAEKTKLAGIAEGAEVNVSTDLDVTVVADTVTVKSSTGNDTVLPIASETTAGLMSAADKQALNGKQATLVSGTNIRTINGQSVLGSGNIAIATAAADVLAAVASSSAGGVGSYVFGVIVPGGSLISFGDTFSGSTIVPACLGTVGIENNASDFPKTESITTGRASGTPLSGTWRIMGQLYAYSYNLVVSLFLRIA